MDLDQHRVTTHEPAANGEPRPGFLRRLRVDARGNTLAIVGAALVPLAGMIGSGVDMSRAYMAKTRLQSACDAASLATRRAMTGDDLTDAVKAEGTKYFNFNFPQGLYETAAFTPEITKPEAGTIAVHAQTTVPTVVMKLFGFQNIPISVDCKAAQNFVNTDIVLVLDTTKSMLCTPAEGGMCSRSSEISTSKIVALRDAVMALYDQLAPIQTELESHGMRLRYSVVPYSMTVNVGKLLNSSYLRTTANYQTRRVATSTSLTSNQCTGSGYRGTYSSGTCHYFVFEQRSLDASGLVAGNTVNLTPLIGGSTPTSTAAVNSAAWNGCIEERQTVSTITSSSGYTIPAGAYDLNVDLIPNSDATRWVPHWPDVEYRRGAGTTSQTGGQNSYYSTNSSNDRSSIKSQGSVNYACPTEARRLRAWTRQEMLDYVNDIVPDGSTYHDIGIIWGARMISAAGVFADSPTEYNTMPVSKHVIFMTDGLMQPGADIYSAYGIEQLDGRIGSYDSTEQTARHTQRFKMMCNAVKGMNVSIWVVAFLPGNQAAGADLAGCASSAAQVANIADRDALIAKFTEIGKNIGALRLSQ